MGSVMSGGHSYVLVLKNGTKSEYSARDAGHALTRARAILPVGRSATLLEDGVPLAEINYSPSGFWSVSHLRDTPI